MIPPWAAQRGRPRAFLYARRRPVRRPITPAPPTASCYRPPTRHSFDAASHHRLRIVFTITASPTLPSGRSGRFAMSGRILYTDCEQAAAATSPDRDVTESPCVTTDRLSIRHSHGAEQT